ncbi:Hypothetical Protein FCC1311_105252 [Hondaea fermentalgiana]|uniref:Uncharacterized protein n=1 Tax=Hondaea fermentalgiana TaxID=2315210 RepID=A0A2R5GTW5_9STRA|nr:Hypothetical Protein FCC1311_105252 [Hondaea fermentalgiana]|eukprot:GBG34302.1 Hypothetical Protein FCC1311_105252 [Hondaea fermentalgiana]
MRELETASSSAESFAMFVLEKKFWEQVGVERMDGAAFNFRDWYESTLRELPLEMRCAKLLDLANLLATRLHHSNNAAASAQNANQQTKGIAMRSPHQSIRPEKPSFKEIVRVERKLNGRTSTITGTLVGRDHAG